MEIPSTIPVIALRDTVFFPQSILPLSIVEPRHHAMLRDVLAGDRIFAVVRQNEEADPSLGDVASCSIATAGMVRASHDKPDGTANLVLQGLSRVQIGGTVAEYPYRRARVEPVLPSKPGDPEAIRLLRYEVAQLVFRQKELSNDVPTEFLQFLETIEDPGAFIDLTAHSTCQSPALKQRLLETLDLEARYQTYLNYLRGQIKRSAFFRQLQGSLAEDAIFLN